MPVQTRSAHAPGIVFNEKPSAPRKQKRTQQSESGSTATNTQMKGKTEQPEAGEKRELPEHDIQEETEVKEVKMTKTELDDTTCKHAFTPGECRFLSSSVDENCLFRGNRARTYILLLPAEGRTRRSSFYRRCQELNDAPCPWTT